MKLDEKRERLDGLRLVRRSPGSDPETRVTINPSADAKAKFIENRTFRPHFRYLPIPQSVLDRNPNFGPPNPGY